MLRCEHLTAYYGSTPVLHDINLAVPPSRFVIISGPNGSGKTTLLRVLRGLISQFGIRVEGKVMLGDTEISTKSPETLGDRVGIVFQRPSLQMLNLTVAEETKIGPILHGRPWEDVAETSEYWINRLDLTEISNDRVFELSGGQQARTVVAAVLSLNPKVLLLDEPGSYFDPKSKLKLLQDLRSLTNQGITIVATSHRIEDELRFADYLVVLNDGRIEMKGVPDDILFAQKLDRLLPPRGFLTVSHALWQRRLVTRKIMDPSLLELKFTPMSVDARASREYDTFVQFQSLFVSYPNSAVAVDSISGSLKDTAINLIVGPNGSGKTTLAKTSAGLLKPSKGTVWIGGRDIKKMRMQEISEQVAYCPADPSDILFQGTVREEIFSSPKSSSLSGPLTPGEMTPGEIATRLHLNDLLDRYPESLSMGQQRRLSIASALASHPRLMILDEPTIGLDSASVELLTGLLNELRSRISLMVISHDLDILLPLADHLLALESGRLIAEGDPRGTFTNELADRLDLKVPECWAIWKAWPGMRTWNDLAEELVKSYDRKMDC